MSARTEVEFEKLAREVVEKASAVKCSRSEFFAGLQFIEEYVRESLEAHRSAGEG